MVEKGIAIFLITLNLVYLYLTLRLEKRGFTTGELGPEVFPTILSILLFLLSFLLLLKESVFKSRAHLEGERPAGKSFIAMAFSIVLMVLYIIALSKIGFLISTPIFLVCFCFLYKIPHWWSAIITASVTTLVIYLVFYNFFRVLLP